MQRSCCIRGSRRCSDFTRAFTLLNSTSNFSTSPLVSPLRSSSKVFSNSLEKKNQIMIKLKLVLWNGEVFTLWNQYWKYQNFCKLNNDSFFTYVSGIRLLLQPVAEKNVFCKLVNNDNNNKTKERMDIGAIKCLRFSDTRQLKSWTHQTSWLMLC